MSDIEISPEARLAVAAGFSFAGPVGNNEAAWRARLNEGVLRSAAQMNGRLAKVAQEVLDADVFKAEFLGYEMEDTSKRLLVRLRSETTAKADDEGDGTEIMRTERTDGAFGRAIQKRLDAIAVGSTILVFKYIEHMEGRGSKNKVRIMKHFEFLAPPADGQPQPSQSQSSTSRPSRAPTGDEHPSTEPPGDTRLSPGGTSDPEVTAAMEPLSNTKKVAVARKCIGFGIPNFVAPADDQERARVLAIIEEVAQA